MGRRGTGPPARPSSARWSGPRKLPLSSAFGCGASRISSPWSGSVVVVCWVIPVRSMCGRAFSPQTSRFAALYPFARLLRVTPLGGPIPASCLASCRVAKPVRTRAASTAIAPSTSPSESAKKELVRGAHPATIYAPQMHVRCRRRFCAWGPGRFWCADFAGVEEEPEAGAPASTGWPAEAGGAGTQQHCRPSPPPPLPPFNSAEPRIAWLPCPAAAEQRTGAGGRSSGEHAEQRRCRDDLRSLVMPSGPHSSLWL